MTSLFRLCLCVLIASTSLFLVSHYIMELSATRVLLQVVQQYHWTFNIWRCGLYVLVLTLWPYFIKLIGIRQKWSSQVMAYLSNQRLKLLGLFVIIEVLFVYNFFGHLFA